MLKYATKRHLILVAIAVLILVVMLGAPLRRDYSTGLSISTKTSSSVTPVEITYTNIHYGLPYAWLSLSKAGGKTIVSKDLNKLAVDVGAWAVCVVLVGLIMRADSFMLPPRPPGRPF